MGRGTLAAVVCCALVTGTATANPSYEERFEEARRLEGQGDPAGALDALDDLEGEFPQDYRLMLQLGWLAYRAGDLERAEIYYTRAEALSGGSAESRQGLQTVASARGVHGFAAASMLGYGYPAVGGGTGGVGLFAAAGVRWRRALGSASYRYGRFGTTDAFGQHEVYLSGGAAWERFGITGHYAVLHETRGTLGTGHVLGAVARFSPLGDVTVEASLSHYDDADVFRVSAAWAIALGRGFWIRPGASMQVADSTPLAAGHLDLGYADSRGEIWIGGKGGSEFRPAYLADDAAYNILETIPWGAHLGGRIHLTERWSLTGTVEAYGATATDLGAGGGSDHVGVVGSIGAAFEF